MLTGSDISDTSTAAIRGGVFVRPDGAPSDSPLTLSKMRKRSDFLAANNGLRVVMPGFILLVRNDACDGDTVRMGITVTKRIGNAVVRGRMKRRFRDMMRQILPLQGIAGADHVLIGREKGIERDFAAMRGELEQALQRIRDGKTDRKPDFRKSPKGQRKGRK